MSLNLVDLIKGQLGGPALGQLGALLGEDNNKTEAAIGAAVPGLLSSLTSSANQDGGASLFNAVNNQDDSMLDNIGGMLTGGDSSNVMNQGSGILGSLLGNGAAGGLANAVSGLTGMGGKSSSGLLGMLMPIILGVVKRQIFGGGGGIAQNAGGLLSMLNGQKDNIQAAMPHGFMDQMSGSGFGAGAAGAVVGGAAGIVGGVAGAASSAASNAAGAVGNVAGNVGNAAGNVAGSVGNVAGNAAGAVGNAAGNVAGSVGNAAGNVGNAAGNVAGKAGDAVGNVAGKAGDAVGNVAGKAGDVAGNVAGKAGDVAGNVAGKAGDVAGNVAGKAGDVAGNVGDAGGKAVSGGGGFLKKFLPIAAIIAIGLLAWKFLTGGGAPDMPSVEVPSVEMPKVEMPEMPGLPEGMSGELGGAVSGAQEALGGITDVDSAKAALPALDGLTGMLDKVPEAARGPLSGVLGGLTPLLEKASAIPGVGDVLAPIAEKLQGFM